MKEHLQKSSPEEPLNGTVNISQESNVDILKKAQELQNNFVNLEKHKNELTQRYQSILEEEHVQQKGNIIDGRKADEAFRILAVINEVKYKSESAKRRLDDYLSTLSIEDRQYIENKKVENMPQWKKAA